MVSASNMLLLIPGSFLLFPATSAYSRCDERAVWSLLLSDGSVSREDGEAWLCSFVGRPQPSCSFPHSRHLWGPGSRFSSASSCRLMVCGPHPVRLTASSTLWKSWKSNSNEIKLCMNLNMLLLFWRGKKTAFIFPCGIPLQVLHQWAARYPVPPGKLRCCNY